MKHILLIVCIFIPFFLIIVTHVSRSRQEGFNSYFRQTIRPHIRRVKNVRNTTMEQFNFQFANIGRIFGIS